MAPVQDGRVALLECERVGVKFERSRRWRPRASTWSAPAGSRTLLLGPSGCGKSTLALALTGLVPDVLPARMRGRVRVDGVEAGDRAHGHGCDGVSIVFQDPDAQLFTETVLDEVCFALENRLLPVDEIERRAERAIRAMGLEAVRDTSPQALSGGERQRVAIACALAAEPRVLVLDEPTANLDPVSRMRVYEALERLPSSSDRAIVLIEHNVDDALAFVDRVVALDARGDLLVQGPVREVLTRHADALRAAGVWLPTGLEVARRVASTPFASTLAAAWPPLTIDETAAALRRLSDAGAVLGASVESTTAPLDPPAQTDVATAIGTRVATSAAASAAEPAISVRSLTVRRGTRRAGVTAIDGLDLDVEQGSFTAIVGVNGAGKSTLLHALAGVIAPTSGTVRVSGRAVRRRGRAPMGLVFQNPEHQFVESTVREELASAADAALRGERRTARVDELLEAFDLTEAANRHPSMLSGGQRRRLSVGTALIGGHRVIAFDEPTFGQDADGAAEIAALMSGLRREGRTVLVVTHDLQLVAELATRVVVLRDGRVVAAGPTEEVLSSPVIAEAGLRPPPLCEAALVLPTGSGLRGLRRLRDLDRLIVGDRTAG